MSSSLTQGEDEGVADGLSDNSSRLTKDGFPQLCEQGDNICQIKWYNDVSSRKTYTIKNWLKSAPEIWAYSSMINVRMVVQQPIG